MGNNGRDSIWKDNVPVSIFPDILAVAEQRMQAALTEGLVHAGQDMPLVEGIDDAAGWLPLRISLVNLPHNRRSQWIDFEVPVFP